MLEDFDLLVAFLRIRQGFTEYAFSQDCSDYLEYDHPEDTSVEYPDSMWHEFFLDKGWK